MEFNLNSGDIDSALGCYGDEIRSDWLSTEENRWCDNILRGSGEQNSKRMGHILRSRI